MGSWREQRPGPGPIPSPPRAFVDVRVGAEATALALLAAILCGAILAPRSLALDGVVAARGNHQEGRAGEYAYSSDNLHLTSTVEERLRLKSGLGLRLSYLATWEERENRVGGSLTESDQWLGRPQASLSYTGSGWRCGWTGYALRTEQSNQGVRIYRDDRLDNSLHANWKLGGGTVDGRWRSGWIERQDAAGFQKNSDRLWSVNTQYQLGGAGQARYGYSRASNRAETAGSRNIYERHSLEYQGGTDFGGNRARIGWSARTTWFRQRSYRDVAGSLEYVEPFWSGYRLDDTPEFRDPLEPDPVLVTALADNDRDAPTGIDIGDAAEQVREFGGDYRNLILDFGDPEEIVAGNLYIDRRLVLPDLMQWHVYLNDDPDGREWGAPLSDAEVSISYREWADGRQGWEIRFADPVTPRRLKLVNSKLGVTEPEIFVTELEVFRAVPAERTESETSSVRHRYGATVDFAATDNLRLDYGLNLDLRRFEEDSRNSTGVGQALGVDWIRGGWVLAGNYQDSRRIRDAGTDTEVNSQTLSLAPVRRGDFHMRYSAGRSQDLSQGRDQVSWNLAADATWRALPALQYSQRVNFGYRDDRGNDLTASSWALISRVRSSPLRSLRVDLTRRDRWVDREAGYGFMTFNDTELLVAWAVTRQITASSRVRYQERDENEWVLRHYLSWSPYPGGNLEMRLYLNGFRDTRNDSRQRGQGVALTWQPRARLYIEGGYNISEYRQGDSESSPTNLNFRGTWSF